jgi:hypothetical protein
MFLACCGAWLHVSLHVSCMFLCMFLACFLHVTNTDSQYVYVNIYKL